MEINEIFKRKYEAEWWNHHHEVEHTLLFMCCFSESEIL
ncbi:hypothetical protein ABIE66_003058 [Peribacillus sp. B2I2]